jgi:hypothetical protein
VVFGFVVLRAPATIVVNSKDGCGPAVVVAGELNRALAAELVIR